MATQILPATADNIKAAAQVLRAGGIVAFPTETVYGLAANALNANAVAKIFEVKGRPSTNPVIVHVADVDAARALSADWPAVADTLAARFWPGPLTLVVEKASVIPPIVTANGATVGVRIPSHPVALDLLRACRLPLAAPSANRSEEVSPTTAQHVADALGPFVNDLLILNGGPCAVGLESTVLDLTSNPPRILRPGMVTLAMLCEVSEVIAEGSADSEIARSPGQMTRHYAPRKTVLVVSSEEVTALQAQNDGVVRRARIEQHYFFEGVQGQNGTSYYAYLLPFSVAGYAAHLYEALHVLDAASVPRILIEEPPRDPEWAAIHDRLQRAAATK